ncbi:MAG: hypothetical protein ACPGU5_05815 [Lishizhenia sp.]
MDYIDPYYEYDLTLLEKTIKAAQREAKINSIKLYYAIKANHEPEILSKILDVNLGIDAVSQEEIKHSIHLGFSPDNIVFAGSGKTYREIEYALYTNIKIIHCESKEEFHIIKKLKRNLNSMTSIALRLNPDFKVNTQEKIATGEDAHKFGLTLVEAKELIAENANDIIGFHIHVGSQIEDLAYFESLSKHIAEILDNIPNYTPSYLNLGGGLGINYNDPIRFPIPDFQGWMQSIRKYLPESKFPEISLEPGRSLVGQCGKIIAQVQYIKKREKCKIALLNVGMSSLIRPMLYGAFHKMTSQNSTLVFDTYRIAGPSCESTDIFHDSYDIEKLFIGDIVEIHSTGAYGASMHLTYNLKAPIAKKFVSRNIKTNIKSSYEKAISSSENLCKMWTHL